MCCCGEPDCARPPLAVCQCHSAERMRQHIVEQVQGLGFGTPERDDATYAAILQRYTAEHGDDATLSATRRSEWLDKLFALGVGLSAMGVLLGSAEAYRRWQARVAARKPAKHVDQRRSGPSKSLRARRAGPRAK